MNESTLQTGFILLLVYSLLLKYNHEARDHFAPSTVLRVLVQQTHFRGHHISQVLRKYPRKSIAWSFFVELMLFFLPN